MEATVVYVSLHHFKAVDIEAMAEPQGSMLFTVEQALNEDKT